MSDSLGVPTAGGAAAPDFSSALTDKMGIVITQISAERTVATMPVEGNTQPFGLLHGGASAVLAETVGSIAANVHAGTMGMVAVGLEISATHHRGLRSGTVTGTAQAVHRGRSTATYEIEILDESGKRVCTSRLTCMFLPDPAKS
ncbi:hotdog fold thioesterase [Kineosporia mesophila]|uniref:Hotdog fold thioesterase n=1 Tax=Kineosporia mesophila TaxID=566012 RepID=A0ABP7AQ07_9ACTN|nr:hotdog fold thioesterase [Kineosporia mesophila]MCD5349259.1 hotdog fold thioesterase [Kineosporia mesophila]